MCFAPQRRTLFRHLNFQKWSRAGVLCTFWLGHVLRTTTACTFSTSQLPKLLRTWCALYILTWKFASRHNSVRLFDVSTSKVVRRWCVLYILTWRCASRHISYLTTWLRTRRFSEPTFRPPEATNHWKNTYFAVRRLLQCLNIWSRNVKLRQLDQLWWRFPCHAEGLESGDPRCKGHSI